MKRLGQPTITDLVMDLQDGVVLCHLVGSLTHQKVRGFTAKPRSPAHKMANLSLALDTAEAAGVRLESVGPQDFMDMNTKMVLGFIWTMITKYGVGGSQGSDELRQTLSRLAGGAPVANLTTAFSDGVLFAKMVDQKKKGLINPDSLDASRKVDNVGNALYLMEQHFGLAHVLDASDIANNPDEKAMAAFLPTVVEALEGRAFAASPAHDDHAPKVFSRASTNATDAHVITSPPRNTATTPTRSTSTSAMPGASIAPSPSRGGHVPTQSYLGRGAGAGAPVNSSAPSGGAGRPPTGVRTTPLLDFSTAVASKYPGIPFTAVNVDGRSQEGLIPCQQCGGELGNGRCFKFTNAGATQYIHSRCFDCSVCRKDFITGQFYLSPQGKLQCSQHYMEEQGVVCKSCGEAIADFFVTALDAKFHEGCFNCHGSCRQPFKEPKFFNQNGLPFCAVCSAAAQGRVCHRCHRGVPNPVKAMDVFWCEEHFSCEACNKVITGNYVELDGWPYHSECANAPRSSAPPPARTSPRAHAPSSYSAPPPASSSYSSPASSSYSAPAPSVSSPPPAASGSPCSACNQNIPMGEAVTTGGKRYHKTCFACYMCRKPIKGSFFSLPGGFCCPDCEKNVPPDVVGGSFPCAKCGKTLVGSVVQALGKEYHKECFVCNAPGCGKQFSGGSFYTFNGQPVCQDHAGGF